MCSSCLIKLWLFLTKNYEFHLKPKCVIWMTKKTRLNSGFIQKFFKNSGEKIRRLPLKRIQIDFLWILLNSERNNKHLQKCLPMVAMAKCAMVMTKIECYLPAIYRLNQEVLREECRIDTLDYENQNNQTSYPLLYVEQLSGCYNVQKVYFFFSLSVNKNIFEYFPGCQKGPCQAKIVLFETPLSILLGLNLKSMNRKDTKWSF